MTLDPAGELVDLNYQFVVVNYNDVVIARLRLDQLTVGGGMRTEKLRKVGAGVPVPGHSKHPARSEILAHVTSHRGANIMSACGRDQPADGAAVAGIFKGR